MLHICFISVRFLIVTGIYLFHHGVQFVSKPDKGLNFLNLVNSFTEIYLGIRKNLTLFAMTI